LLNFLVLILQTMMTPQQRESGGYWNWPQGRSLAEESLLIQAKLVKVPLQLCRMSSQVSVASIKMGTTVATNALLERSADQCALVVSKGHKDLLRIGDQTRPKLFDLNIRRASPLFSQVLEVDERVTPEEYTEDPSPKSAHELEALVDDVEVVKGVGGELIRILKPLGKSIH